MDKNHEFLSNVAIADIPWNRLATTYGRATDFPVYFQTLLDLELPKVKKAGYQMVHNIEHQSTLWPASPFAMIFLARILKKAFSNIKYEVNRYIAEKLIALFVEVVESCVMGDKMEHADPLPFFQDMLKEKYLWSEEYDEEKDMARYEEDGGPFPDDLFYSFYYYSYEVLKSCKDDLQTFSDSVDSEISSKIKRLISLIN